MATSTLSNPAQWLIDWIRGPVSDAGVSVTVDSSLSYPPVWYAVNKIAGHVGQLPCNLHRRLERGAEHASENPVYHLMRTRPNPYQTAIVFKEQLMTHALLTGNGRAAIIRDSRGKPSQLVPLMPGCTYTCMVEGAKWHVVECRDDDHLANNYVLDNRRFDNVDSFYRIRDEDVFHIPGLSYDGLTGVSLLAVARESIGLGLSAQKAMSHSFKNGSKPGVVIEAPPGAFRDEKDAAEFIKNFNQYHEGLDNSGRAALMREGMKLSTLSISAADSQWIEQRRFQRQDAALLFLLEQILGDDSSVSYNSLEQKNLAYLSSCLMRWLLKWEQEADYKLLSTRESRDLYFKFNTAALLRSDFKTTMTSLEGAVRSMIMSPNEAREKIDMNPYEGGDKYANPAIYVPENDEGVQEGTDTADPSAANRSAIVAHFRHLIGVECNRVLSSAGNKKNYVGWVDHFYGDKWQKTMSHAVISMGGDTQIACDYCETSRQLLIEMCGSVSPDGLADAVSELTENWQQRADDIAARILEGI